jgi:cytochrome c oxidase assembly factor CtaG
MAAAASRFRLWRAATHPAVALPLWLVNYYVWHVPVVYDGALHHQSSLIHLEHASYFATGILFWWPLVHDQPRRLPSGFRAAYAFAAFVLAAPLGLLLALVPRAIYGYYEHAPRLWGLSPLSDQELAGATMAAEQALVLFLVFAFWFRRFLIEEGAVA